MSSIGISDAKERYGGDTETEIIKNVAQRCGCYRIYKYSVDGETYTVFKRIETPADEEALLRSSTTAIKPLLVFDRGTLFPAAIEQTHVSGVSGDSVGAGRPAPSQAARHKNVGDLAQPKKPWWKFW
jgi:hypothetical protein